MKNSDKAALIYRILDKDLPLEVFNYLSDEEAKKILTRYEKVKSSGTKQENQVLLEFNQSLISEKSPSSGKKISNQKPKTIDKEKSKPSYTMDQEMDKILTEIQNIVIEEENQSESVLEILQNINIDELGKLIFDEEPSLIAQILTFCPLPLAKEAITKLPSHILETVFEEMENLDTHSRDIQDEVERFLQYKKNFIHSKSTPQKVKLRQGKKAADLLSSLNPGESKEILSKLQKKRPHYAENIIEHYYSFKDLLQLGRTSLSRFLGEFHPLILATAFKGIEKDLKSEILSSLDPWIVKSIQLESDSLGAVSLAEIEECHLGILDRLREEIEEGKIKLWRLR
jgi:flagellar motor switch protein FliG